MKILRVSIGYPTEEVPGSGLNVYYHSLVSNQKNMIITTKKQSNLLPNNNINTTIIQIPYNKINLLEPNKKNFYSVLRLIIKICNQIVFFIRSKKYIKEYKPDIIHVYTPIPVFFGAYCKRKFKSKYILSLHGTDVDRIVKNKLFRLTLNKPDVIATMSEPMKEKLLNIGIKNPVVVIGNGVDLSQFINMRRKRKKQFIQVASLRWQKGQKYLIEAFKKLVDDGFDYNLKIIGEGPDRAELEEQIKLLKLNDKVTLCGMKSRKIVVEELNESYAFILSSVSEGFPKVIYEAMATGTPIITTDVGSVSDVIKDSGIIVEPYNGDALYEAMKTILSSNWEYYSKKSQEYVKRYTWEEVNNRLEVLYKIK